MIRVILVLVHPPESELAAVHPPLVADDLHAAEPDPEVKCFDGVRDLCPVQTRHVGAPRLHRPDVDGPHFPGTGESLLHPQLFQPDRDGEGRLGGSDFRQEATPPIDGVIVCPQPHILDPVLRAGDEGDRPEDTGEPPLVLVLQVSGGGPLMHPHVQHVPAGPRLACDVQLLRQPTSPDHTHTGPVQGGDRDGLDTIEPQVQLMVQHLVGELEGDAVVAGGVVVRDVGRIHREGIRHVGVDGLAPFGAVLQHPVGRHLDVIPGGVIKLDRRHSFSRRRWPRGEAEPPRSAQVKLGRGGGDPRARRNPTPGPWTQRNDL